MRSKKFTIGLILVSCIVVLSMHLMEPLAVAQEKVVHSFNGNNGLHPSTGVIFDAAGSLFGTANEGGAYNNGMVFELSRNGGGGWTEKALHSFNNNSKDGLNPNGVTFDAAGNLWGTTHSGLRQGYGVRVVS